jgi:hypothetical protein
LEDQCVITREITVAADVFAPGHLGELTQIVPFEMVDQALAATSTTQARLRVLPSRVVVYLLLAGCLFAELRYRQVWHKLAAGLGDLPAVRPSDNALWQARSRLGAAPLRWLFDLLRGPATAITARPVRWHGLLVCAIDGTTMTIADSPGNLAAYSKRENTVPTRTLLQPADRVPYLGQEPGATGKGTAGRLIAPASLASRRDIRTTAERPGQGLVPGPYPQPSVWAHDRSVVGAPWLCPASARRPAASP